MFRQSATFRFAILVTLVASGCAETQIPNNDTQTNPKLDKPSATGSIDDLSTDAVAILRQLPSVVEVTNLVGGKSVSVWVQ